MARERLNLRHLRVLCEVARSGGVSAAAPIAHLSQPAISQAIAKLEATLGARLFVREAGGMRATEAGAAFVARAERALDHLDDACRRTFRTADAARSLTGAHLRTLLALAAAQGFLPAARKLGLAQPTLHRQARALEQICGAPLFRANVYGVELTWAAKALARAARLALAELDQAVQEIDASRGVEATRITIGALPLPRSRLLPNAINAATLARPTLRVRVVDGPYEDLLAALRQGEIDVLVGALRSPRPAEDVVQTPLFEDELGLFVRAGHPLTRKAELTMRDLVDAAWVTPREATPTRAQFDRLFAEAGAPTPTRLVETSSLALVRGLLLESDRITILSAHQIAHLARLGEVARLPFDLGDTRRPIGLTVRADWRPTAGQAEMLAALAAAGARIAAELDADAHAAPPPP